MPTITLTIDQFGKPCGLSKRDDDAYAKFKARLKSLTPADSLIFSWREPRSGPYHRRHFAMLDSIFESQEKFMDAENFRKWLEVGAGYCVLVPGPQGTPVAIPDTIKYDRLDQAEFELVHNAVFAFARSQHVTRFLWPHLSDEQGAEMIDRILMEFE